MSDILRKIADNVRYYRSERGLTQKQLAKKAKISRGYVSQIENAKANIYLTTLIELAKGLRVGPNELAK